MSRGRRPFVAAAIVEYFRKQCAIASSEGLEVSSEKISEAIEASQASTSINLKKLLDCGVIILKKGIFEKGYNGPKSFALAEGHEEGDDWKNAYHSGKSSIKSSVPLKPSSENKNLLTELSQSYSKIQELQEVILKIQEERNQALKESKAHLSRINELETELRLASESDRRNQQDVVTLELQLRELRSRVSKNDRLIAKSQGESSRFANR